MAKRIPLSCGKRAAALTVAAMLLVAATDYSVSPIGYRLLTPEAGNNFSEQHVVPGSIVARAQLGRPDSALIVGPIALDYLGEKRAFANGDVLAGADLTGPKGTPKTAFCEQVHLGSIGKIASGQLLFGLVGALRSTKVDTRYCLIDTDGDRTFDHALLIGAKGRQQGAIRDQADNLWTDHRAAAGRR